jgi:hypothetical protein
VRATKYHLRRNRKAKNDPRSTMFEPIGKDFTKFFVCKKEEAESEAKAV